MLCQFIFSLLNNFVFICRDVTLTPSPYRTTPKPHPVIHKLQTHLASAGARTKAPMIATSSNLESISVPNNLISSYAHFGPSAHMVRDSKPKISAHLLGLEQSPFGSSSSTGHLTAGGHFVSNSGNNYQNPVRFPQNAISSAYSHQQQQQTQLRQQHYQHLLTQQLQYQQQQANQQQQQIQYQHQHQQQQQQIQQQQQQKQQQEQQKQQQDQQLQQQQHHEQQERLKEQQLQQQQQDQALQLQQQQQQQQQARLKEQQYLKEQHELQEKQRQQKLNQQHLQQQKQLQEQEQQQHQQQHQQHHHEISQQHFDHGYHHHHDFHLPHHSETFLTNYSKPVYEPSGASEEHNNDFENHFNQIAPSMEPSTRGPGAYLPPIPSVPPSILSPFFQQIQQQQQQSSTIPTSSTTEPNHVAYHHNFSQSYDAFNRHLDSQFPNFKALEDEFSSNLVPPPPYKHRDTSQFRERPISSSAATYFDADQVKAIEILNKYNIPAISPLQDANRYAYNSHPSVSISSTTFQPSLKVSEFPQTSFTTEKPNIFRNLNRPLESEYKQHKVMHPGYTGILQRPKPSDGSFIPTPQSPDLSAITHSFFTIEDAVTLPPKFSHNIPINPTNTNQIEAIIGKPQEEEITEIITMRPPVHGSPDDIQQLEFSTVQQTPSTPAVSATPSPRMRGKNKIRRRRPRPSSSTENSIDNEEPPKLENEQLNEDQGHWETIKNIEMRKPQPVRKEVTERYANHREVVPTENTSKESELSGHRNANRNRNRGRPAANVLEVDSSSEKPTRGRRPLHRVEEKKPSIRTTTPLPTESATTREELTTINLRENLFLANYNQKPRRPYTTQQTFFSPTIQQNAPTENVYPRFPTTQYPTEVISVTVPQTRPVPRPRTTSTSVAPPPPNDIIIGTTVPIPRENPSILTTHGVLFNNEIISTYQPEQITNAVDDFRTYHNDNILTTPVVSASPVPQYIPEYTTTTTTTTTTQPSTTENYVPKSEQPIIVKPVLDNVVTAGNDFNRHRLRLRYKDKIKETYGLGTSTSTTTTLSPYTEDENDLIQEQEITDISKEQLNVRLPIIKSSTTTTKSTSSEETISPPLTSLQPTNKSTRLNAVNKYDSKNRPRFSVKDYRQRLITSSTTVKSSSTEERESTTTPTTTRLRYPTRNRLLPELKNKSTERIVKGEDLASKSAETESGSSERPFESAENSEQVSTENYRKRFSPKDRFSSRIKSTTENPSTTSRTTSTRTRSSSRHDFATRGRFSSTTQSTPVENSVTRLPTIRNALNPLRRPQNISLRQRIANQKSTTAASAPLLSSSLEEDTIDTDNNLSKSDISIDNKSDDYMNTENYKQETAIMKIAKDDHSYRPHMHATKSNEIDVDMNGSPSEQSERVAELTIFGNSFNSVNTASGASRHVPGYFTIATEDPILPIEAFFPQVKKT